MRHKCILGTVVLMALALGWVRPVMAAPFAYITNSDDNTVSVLDTATNAVTATIPVGTNPGALAVSPDGTRVYVANGVGSLSVLDAATNTVMATVSVGSGPFGLAVTPDGTRVYVANYNDYTVSVIDTATNTVATTIPVGQWPYGVAAAPDGSRVYVAVYGRNTLATINTATNTVTATVPVGTAPFGLAVTPDGTHVYVANYLSNDVSVVSTSTNTVVATVPAGPNPHGIAVTPDGSRVYVANFGGYGSVWVIATSGNTAVATIDDVVGPSGVAITPDGTRVYVANYWDNSVSVIATATNTVSATVPVGTEPVAFGQFIIPALSPATLIAPHGTDIGATPAYTWNAVPGATWYELWVNDSAQVKKFDIWYTAAGVGCAGGTGTCGVVPSIPLAMGPATWWIQWWGDLTGYGTWSLGMDFTVNLPSTMATLVSPSGTIGTATPTYTWAAVPGMTWYYLWVQDATGVKVQQWMEASTAGCGSGTGTCSYTPSTALAPGAATWWTQVWSPAGYGPWSDGKSFTVP